MTNEELAHKLINEAETNNDPVLQARASADRVSALIIALDEADRVINEEMAELVRQLDENNALRLKHQKRRRQLRRMANELEAERDADPA